MAIKKFGQYVHIQVHSESGALVFETDSLKIDFDIRHIQGWSRAKFTLTNLAPETIRNIGNANNNNYVTIMTALHDSEPEVIADRMYISNALEEIDVPESVFNMYCYSKTRQLFMETQIDVQVPRPTLRNKIETATRASGFKGPIIYKHFPSGVLDFIPPRPISRQQGSMLSVINLLGEQNNFNSYTVGNAMVFMYKPNSGNVADTDLYTSEGDIKLSTTNMRANPKIGPATLSVVSNLDPRIQPATILDISELLTLGTDVSEETLQVAEKYLKEKISGFSKYQTLAVQHKGSNWSSTWITQVSATSPTPGTTMPTTNWWS